MKSCEAFARSTESPVRGLNLIFPSDIRPPPNSTRRMRERDVTDFPEPDSPTRQTVSPGSIEKRDTVYGDDHPAISLELNPQAVDLHQRPGGGLRCETRFSD